MYILSNQGFTHFTLFVIEKYLNNTKIKSFNHFICFELT